MELKKFTTRSSTSLRTFHGGNYLPDDRDGFANAFLDEGKQRVKSAGHLYNSERHTP
jgi:hypothetical protein